LQAIEFHILSAAAVASCSMAISRPSCSRQLFLTNFIRWIIFFIAKEMHAYQEQAESSTDRHALYAQSLDKSISLLLTTKSEEAFALASHDREETDGFSLLEKHSAGTGPGGDPFLADKAEIEKQLEDASTRCDGLQRLVLDRAERGEEEWINFGGEGMTEDAFNRAEKWNAFSGLPESLKLKVNGGGEETVRSLKALTTEQRRAKFPITAAKTDWTTAQVQGNGRGGWVYEHVKGSLGEHTRDGGMTSAESSHRHPGFHALEVINKLHPCLEDIKILGEELNKWIERSTAANNDLYHGFNKIFHTVHTLKESKLERMFKQQHERVWKTLINRASQIQTVLDALYNPMQPGKGWFNDERGVITEPETIATKIEHLTKSDLTGYQKHVPWLYETDRALSAPRNPAYGECKVLCDRDAEHVNCKACVAEQTNQVYCATHTATKGCVD